MRTSLRICFLSICAFSIAQVAHAVSCSVVHHGPLSPAEQAWASGDAEKATDLWRAQLKANPVDTAALVGLVHGLLRTGNIDEAEKLVNDALAASSPNSASMVS